MRENRIKVGFGSLLTLRSSIAVERREKTQLRTSQRVICSVCCSGFVSLWAGCDQLLLRFTALCGFSRMASATHSHVNVTYNKLK